MNTFDFYFSVLPLGILVFFSAALLFYYARKQERVQRKLTRIIQTYTKERQKQKENLAKELSARRLLWSGMKWN